MTHILEGIIIILVGMILTKLLLKVIRTTPILMKFERINREQDDAKRSMPKYARVLAANKKAETYPYLVVALVIAPFFASFDALPAWRYVTDILVMLLIYDLLYYLTHRFLFHGNSYFKRIHGVHHQARDPSYIDAHYVHPLETTIGLSVLGLSLVIAGIAVGGFNIWSLAVGLFVYSQVNVLIHTQFDEPQFPYKTATWLVRKHHLHHLNMNQGNYSSLFLIYDKLFGTLESDPPKAMAK